MTLIIPQLIDQMLREGCTCPPADVLRSVRCAEGQEPVYTFRHQMGCPYMEGSRELPATTSQPLS